MAQLPLLQIDAFTDRIFGGNPAAVAPLEVWPDDDALQRIAQENNLSETAFFVATPDNPEADFHLRWMTPKVEVALCGHATLASAHALWTELGFAGDAIRFSTNKSGVLMITRDEAGRIRMDFPRIGLERIDAPRGLADALGATPTEVYKSYDYICVFDDEDQVRALDADFRALARVEGCRAVGVTAPGTNVDLVARLFAPAVGIDEDPATGSLYTMLGPYWSERLGKRSLSAQQLSTRLGELWLSLPEDKPDRIEIAGHAVTYMRGQIDLPR